MNFDEAPDLLTVAEVQQLTRWSRNSIYEAIKQGRFPAIWLAKAVRVPKWRLITFIENGGAVPKDDATPVTTPNLQERSGHGEE